MGAIREIATRYNVYFVSMGAPSLYMLLAAMDRKVNPHPVDEAFSSGITTDGLGERFDENIAPTYDLLEEDFPNEVVYVDLGFDYPEVKDTASMVEKLCVDNGITFTRLYHNMRVEMFEGKKINCAACADMPISNFQKLGLMKRGGKGYGWCGGKIRWGTTIKANLIREHLRKLKKELVEGIDIVAFIGITYDEKHRLAKNVSGFSARGITRRYPLVEKKITKWSCIALAKVCLNYWGLFPAPSLKLYDYGLSHIGCWCCRNHNIKELMAIKTNMPAVFEDLKLLEEKIKEPYYRSPRGWAKLDNVCWQRTKYEEPENDK